MSNKNKLFVRLEFVGGSSSKFWQLKTLGDGGELLAEWGRIGRDPQGSKVYTALEATKLINEKIAKGYRMVSGQHTEQSGAIERMKKKRDERKAAFDFMEELRKLGGE